MPDSEGTATTTPAPSTEVEKSPPQVQTEPELATQPEAPEDEEQPREQIPNISVDPEEEPAQHRPLLSDPMPNMVDDAQLALNQARMVANTEEKNREGKDILLATPWQTDLFRSGDGSFPDITSEGTWVTTEEAEVAELAAHRCGAKLYRKEG